jgi:FMN phosphatase YigB (HAD superfamily)
MFDPEKFIQTLTINYEGIDFVRSCKADGHSVYILSNWDAESFALFAKKNKWFIELFDGIVISGEVGHVKPDPYIYQYLLTQYAIDPKNAFFVDDIIHNTRAAQDLDIFSVQCKQRSTLMGPFPHFAYIRDMFALWTDAQSHTINHTQQ